MMYGRGLREKRKLNSEAEGEMRVGAVPSLPTTLHGPLKGSKNLEEDLSQRRDENARKLSLPLPLPLPKTLQ